MKKIFVLTLGIIFFGLLTGSVRAETISYKKLDNIYFNLKVDGVSSSNGVTMFYLDGRLAYCIEPGASINTKTYNSTSDWSKTNFSSDTQRYLEKLGYYGYEYTGHQTPKFYIATQELIWKAIKNVEIVWTTGKDGTGSVIDVSEEKNEILRLADRYDMVPSFAGDIVVGEKGTLLNLEDNNGVLDHYNLSASNYHKITKEDNKLKIEFNADEKEEEILLTRKNNYNDLLLVYTMPGSQSLASLRISSPLTAYFKVKSISISKDFPKKEVVKVPSTGDDYNVKHFGVLKFLRYDCKYFS